MPDTGEIAKDLKQTYDRMLALLDELDRSKAAYERTVQELAKSLNNSAKDPAFLTKSNSDPILVQHLSDVYDHRGRSTLLFRLAANKNVVAIARIVDQQLHTIQQ